MNISMIRRFDSTSNEIVEIVERALGFRFPPPYRRFVLKYNGGKPEAGVFKFNDKSDASVVDYFLTLSKSNTADFFKYYRTYRSRVPENFVPIAHDPGGNLLVIGVAGENWGKVFFWDHEFEVDDEENPNMSNMHLVCASFDELLENLSE